MFQRPPHVTEVVGAAQRAGGGAVPGVESVALVLVGVPGVHGVGAFGYVQVWADEDVGALEEAGHLPEEGLILGSMSVLIMVYAKGLIGIDLQLWLS